MQTGGLAGHRVAHRVRHSNQFDIPTSRRGKTQSKILDIGSVHVFFAAEFEGNPVRQWEISQSAYAAAKNLPETDCSCAVEILDTLKTGDMAAAFNKLTEFWKQGISSDRRNSVRHLLDEKVLRSNELEVTNHGFKRTFRFWSVDEKRSYLQFAKATCDTVAEKVSANVCLGYGAALAIARSNDLIPHDDDLDLIVGLSAEEFPTFQHGIEFIENRLSPMLQLAGQYPSHRHIIDPGSANSIDLFIGVDEDGYFSSYPGPRKSLRMHTIYPPVEKELFGVVLPMPRALHSYLSQVYGPNWEIPDPTFSHNWDRSRFAPLM